MGIEFKVTKPIYDKSLAIEDWQDPKWQLRFSLKKKEDFARYFRLSKQEEEAFDKGSQFNVQTTPYYASLAKDHPEDPIRKIFMPTNSLLCQCCWPFEKVFKSTMTFI